MNENYLNVYCREIEHQANLAVYAFESLVKILDRDNSFWLEVNRLMKEIDAIQDIMAQLEHHSLLREMQNNYDSKAIATQIWFYVQSFLVAAANISKILWKSLSKRKAPVGDPIFSRPTNLRQYLGLNGFFEIEKREMRDHFEHIEERLDVWVMEGNIWIADSIIGSFPLFNNDKSNFRRFDPNKYLLKFQDVEIDLIALHSEIVEIHSIVVTKLTVDIQSIITKPHPKPQIPE